MDRHQLINLIAQHSEATKLAPATITGRAVNNSRLYTRLLNGGDCTTQIAAKIAAYIADNPPARTSEGASA